MPETKSPPKQNNEITRTNDEFKILIDCAPYAIAHFDRAARYLYINEAFERATGISRDKAIGRPVLETNMVEGQASLIDEAVRRVFATRREEVVEMRVGGRYYQSRFVPQRGADGTIESVIKYSDDITERRQIEEAAWQSKERLSRIVETIPDGIVIVDLKGQIIYANSAAESILGLKRDTLTRKLFNDPSWEITTIEGGPFPEDERPYARVMKTGEPVCDMEYAQQHPGGTRVLLSVSAAALRDKDGNVSGVVTLTEDITGRKAAEKALQGSQQMLRNILENFPGVVFWKDRHSVYLGANKAFSTAAGLDDPADIVGKTDYDLPWAATEADAYRADDRRVMESGIPRIGIIEIQHQADGRVAWFDTNKIPLFDAKGTLIGVLGASRDITEHKKNEEALRLSEERNRGIVQTSPDSIVFTDVNSKIIICNHQTAVLHGIAHNEDLVGVNSLELIAPEDRERAIENRAKTIEGGYIKDVEYTFLKKDGSRFPAELSASVIRDSAGRPTGFTAITRDITERKRYQEQLGQSVEKLQHTLTSIINAISKLVEMRDPYTAGHQRHVSQLAYAIAIEMGLPKEQADVIRIAGIIHDVGKLNVPAEILSKPGRLSSLDYAVIKIHPAAGYEIIRLIDFPWPVAEVAYQHQERIDGSGYPRGLKGEGICLEARIVSVADVIEAMSFPRPYRPVIGLERALKEISNGKNILYYAPAVEACLKLFRENRFHFH